MHNIYPWLLGELFQFFLKVKIRIHRLFLNRSLMQIFTLQVTPPPASGLWVFPLAGELRQGL
jgi:hypothetical protein